MKNIVIFYGGKSVEHDISIITALQMYHHLDREKYKVIPIYINDGIFYTSFKKCFLENSFYVEFNSKKAKIAAFIGKKLFIMGSMRKKRKIDCALICCHGGEGENGSLQGMLEVLGIPYTSPSMQGSNICMDKAETHVKAVAHGAKCVNYKKINSINCIDKIDKIIDELGSNLVIKPNTLGSSIGVTFACDKESLKKGLETASIYDKNIIIEEKVEDMLELNCAVVKTCKGVIVSDVERPIAQSEILDFADKYLKNGKMCGCGREFPAQISEELAKKVKFVSENVYNGLNLKGVVRIDYLFAKKEKELYLNEINAVPGSLAYYLFENLNLDCCNLLSEMIDYAIFESKEEDKILKKYKSSVLNINKNNGSNKLQKM